MEEPLIKQEPLDDLEEQSDPLADGFEGKLENIPKVNDEGSDLKVNANLLDEQIEKPVVAQISTTLGKVFSCKSCSFITECQDVFNVHVKSHSNSNSSDVNRKCNICGFKADSLENLEIHAISHFGRKPLSCKHCSYQTVDENRFKVHTRKHTALKPFACQLCEYSTTYVHCLLVHMKKHTGEKRHNCTFCKYRTDYKRLYVKHMRKHRDNNFSCKFCEFRTADPRHFRSHLCTYNTSDTRHYKIFLPERVDKAHYSIT